jgi:hypothetical protein
MSAMEIVGNILGYIPGISSIVGLIKGFVYLKQAKGCEKERQAMAITAGKIDKLVPRTSTDRYWQNRPDVTLVDYKQKNLQILSLLSFLEIIPIINIFAAAYESTELSELHRCKKHLSPDQMIVDLARFYEADLPESGPKRDFCIQVLTIMDNIEIKGSGCTKENYDKKSMTKNIYSNLYVNWVEGQDPKSCVLAELKKVRDYVNNPENENLPKMPTPKPGIVQVDSNAKWKQQQYDEAKESSARFKESLAQAITKLVDLST